LYFVTPTGLIPRRTLGTFNVFIQLNGWICLHGVFRLSRLLVGFRTLHFQINFNSI